MGANGATDMNATATPVEAPSIALPGGVNVFTVRDGERITGSVQFPYEVRGRRSVPIDYQNVQPVTLSEAKGLDAKASARLALVQRWQELCESDKGQTRRDHARRLCAEIDPASPLSKGGTRGVSPRSLQLWARKLDTQGPQALADGYEGGPRKVLSLDGKVAKDALSICAWWCFRIGNEPCIDFRMMHFAASLRPRAPFLRDILSAIEVYYSWPTDRLVVYPFKPFARFAKYDFEKWLYRALADKGQAERQHAASPGEVPLQIWGSAQRYETEDGDEFIGEPRFVPVALTPTVPGERSRKREVAHSRRAVAAIPSEPGARATGQFVPDVLSDLDDRQRWMLIRAARGESQARREAVATMALWWGKIPPSISGNIDVRAGAWQADHRAPAKAVAGRKLAMLIPHLKRPRRPIEPVSKAVQGVVG